jgi:uncharacterized protein (DUF1501 family)
MKLLTRLEAEFANRGGKQEVGDHQKVYAQAAKMITSPKMATFDLAKEPQKVQEAYGSGQFGQGCLLARRLIESGVTFVEVSLGNWDTHFDNFPKSKDLCGQLDQPLAALLADLNQKGMLDSTLVVWTGEFGRTPFAQGSTGRDHNPHGFTVWLAGGGVKGGMTYGATDEYGYHAVENVVTIHDLHATMLHLLGFDHTRLTYRYAGRDFRLTDVHGQVVTAVLA